MASALLGALICLSPLAFVALGYAWGRYGLPVEIRRRRPADRRARQVEAPEAPEAPAVEVYRYDSPAK